MHRSTAYAVVISPSLRNIVRYELLKAQALHILLRNNFRETNNLNHLDYFILQVNN